MAANGTDTGPLLSLIVPTRGRPDQLRRFLDSLAATATNPDRIQLILVVDEDDPDTLAFRHSVMPFELLGVPPGRTMGILNRTGYAAAKGELLMLLNDDVIVRTPSWDRRVVEAAASFPDGIVLIHVNDLTFKNRLCIFPIVTRTFCEMAGGICPADYVRYRIDDHIFNIFRILSCLGEKRIVYLPDLVFEHTNVTVAAGKRRYVPVRKIHRLDTLRYRRSHEDRKKLATRLGEHIENCRPKSFGRAQGRTDTPVVTASRNPSNLGIRKSPDSRLTTPGTSAKKRLSKLVGQFFRFLCVNIVRRYK